jgi:hypothetical protein
LLGHETTRRVLNGPRERNGAIAIVPITAVRARARVIASAQKEKPGAA